MRRAAVVIAIGVADRDRGRAAVAAGGHLAARQSVARRCAMRSTLIGAPAVVSTDIGPAIQFNGATDGLLIERNPLEGLAQFTIEVLFSRGCRRPGRAAVPARAGSRGRESRAVELRLNDGRWALDSYLRHGDAQLTLLDRSQTHAAERLARGVDDVRRHDDAALRRRRRAGRAARWRSGRSAPAARRSACGRIACRGSRAVSTRCASLRRC